MPMNSAVREMLPAEAGDLGDEILALEDLARVAQRQAHELLAPCPVRRRRHQRPDLGGQHLGRDLGVRVAGGQDHQPLDVVAQLPDVAGPVVRLQHRHRVVGDAPLRQAGRGGDLVHEEGDQLGHVLAPLGQGRHPDRHDAEAVEQVLAEAAGGDLAPAGRGSTTR